MAADASLPAAVWRADQLGHRGTAALDSGFPSLNAELPGSGWPLGMLTELIIREPGSGEMRLLVPLLRALTRERKVVILLAPPLVPYAPALAGFGIDLDCLVIVQARHAADRLWAVEQSLKNASFGALLAWLPHEGTRPEHLRRLQLAAQTARGPVFLFRPLPAQFESSPAPLRLLLLPRPDEHLSVQVLKRRGPVLARPLLLELHKPVTAIRLRPSSPRRPAPEPAPALGQTPTPGQAPAPTHAPAVHAPAVHAPAVHAPAVHALTADAPQLAPRRSSSTLLN